MSWEEDFRRNIERTRQRIMEIAPDMLDLNAHRTQLSPAHLEAHRSHPPVGRTLCSNASILAQNTVGVGEQSPPIIRGKAETGWLPPKRKTSDSDPGRPGPYSVCQSQPAVFAQAKLAQDSKITQDIPLLAYAPGSMSGGQCASAVSDCPLVVIFHAQPTMVPLAEYYKHYEALAAHLASYDMPSSQSAGA